jgi:ATP-dependent helicase HepA
VFDLYFIEVEELAPRTYQLGSAGVLVDAFPGLTSDGLTITCDRQRALAREDLQFLTWDHPLVTGALDLFLGSEQGNSSFARWPDPKANGLYLEMIFLLECIAPTHYHLDRFLPPTPVRILVDHCGLDVTGALPHQKLRSLLKPGDGCALLERSEIREVLLPKLIQQGEALANRKRLGIVALACKEMNDRMDREIARLRDLQKVNPTVRDEEIALLSQHQSALEQHISAARVRLDAVRLIHRGSLH